MIISEAELLAQALKQKLSRPLAVVLAHILHHEQLEGGVEIGGEQWRYRTVEEIGSRVGYGHRSVARATAQLQELGFIDKRSIWDPRYTGRKVGAFRALPLALPILEKAREGRNRTRKHGDPDGAVSASPKISSAHVRNCQRGSFMDSQPIIEQSTELVTLPPPARESQFEFLSGNNLQEAMIVEAFQRYLDLIDGAKHVDQAPAKIFWDCLDTAINQAKGELVEPFDPMVSKRVSTFLALFKKPFNGWLSDVDQCAIAVWGYVEWPSFRNLIFDLTSKVPEGSMSSYHLEKYAYLIINEMKRRKAYSTAPQARKWLPGFGYGK